MYLGPVFSAPSNYSLLFVGGTMLSSIRVKFGGGFVFIPHAASSVPDSRSRPPTPRSSAEVGCTTVQICPPPLITSKVQTEFPPAVELTCMTRLCLCSHIQIGKVAP